MRVLVWVATTRRPGLVLSGIGALMIGLGIGWEQR